MAAVCFMMAVWVSVLPVLAQMAAFLPDVSTVPPGEPMPIDGVYTLTFNGAQFRIEAGHIIAASPYTHLFVLQVIPGMVTTKDIVRTAPGRYEGYDLPALGGWQGTVQPDRTIKIDIQGKFGPFSSSLVPVSIADPARFNAELAEMRGEPVAPVQYGSRAKPDNAQSIYPPGWDAR